jgi:hypothetical protein
MKQYKSIVTEMKLKLQYHSELNPKLWNEFDLKPEVRRKLLQFAEVWREFAKIPKSAVKDILMLGGNTNYNYTELSDIDVHLVIDKNEMAPNNPLLDDYLQDKKQMWTMAHKITILGYPIEPYAQDESVTAHINQGVFSLLKNEWVAKPEFIGDDMLKNPTLKKKVKFYMRMIDDMIANKSDASAFKNLKEKLRDMRGSAIRKGGEFSFENLVFKELRNQGYLDKMTNYTKTLQDQSLSL